MAATKFGVVYSQTTGRIRAIYIPDTDAQLQSIRPRPGEALQLFTQAEYAALPALQDALIKITGVTPSNDRYAVVDTSIPKQQADATGNVDSVIIADPLCGDSIPGKTLIADRLAGVGWKWAADTGFSDTRPVPVAAGPKGG